jgi:hypothetical protein
VHAVQLAALIPFMRTGEWVLGVAKPTSLEDLNRFTAGEFRAAFSAVWQGFVCAMLTWALVAPVLFLACRAALQPVFTRVVAKVEPPAEVKQAP